MSRKELEKTRKVTGKLIEVLHGDYSDTRDLAVVQLALLGEKVVPYILSFLKKEGDLETDLIEYHKSIELKEKADRLYDDFKKKWGCYPRTDGETEKRNSDQRKDAVEAALEALSLIGDSKAIPILKKLPIFEYKEWSMREERLVLLRRSLFEKVNEAIEKIKLARTS